MRKLLRTVSMLLLCGALCMPIAEARGRNNSGEQSSQSKSGTQSSQNRPSRPGTPSTQRPPRTPNTQGRPGTTSRPSTPSTQRPPSRPGSPSTPSTQRPPRTPNTQGRPGTPGTPSTPSRPSTPSVTHSPYHDKYYRPTPPSRPYLPPSRPYYRPAPPPSWRPVATWRPFRSVLGVTFGSAINVSLNLLFNSGYTVQSYGPNAIYLSNVPMLNCYWPDATMYYSNGALTGSEFVYYTPYASSARYDMAFNALCGSYGAPVSVVNNGGVVTASWWGSGNQYISLSYGGQYAGNGSLGYYTTLTFGI